MRIITVGLDLAKNVFQAHGVDVAGRVALNRQLRRAELLKFFARLEPCVVAMEASRSAHHWARQLTQLGHTVKLMAPQFVKPYVKTNKNDMRDAEAICEAVTRPSMRFVPMKSVEQQEILTLHRFREGLMKSRIALGNQIRGVLAEFGIVFPQASMRVGARITQMIEAASSNEVGEVVRLAIGHLLEAMRTLEEKVEEIERQLALWHRQSEASQRLAAVPGIGVLTATALVASVGDARNFRSGRQFAAWLGLVPRQCSSGERQRLQGISKRGNTYLRWLLIHGARCVTRHTAGKPEGARSWISQLLARKHGSVAAVALANRHARIVWALLSKGCEYQPRLAPAWG
jgi:transposase